MVKQLYIRRGNSPSTQDILIVGDESILGGRDDAYKPSKGAEFVALKKDPYTGAKNLTYIHATPNIMLDVSGYERDYVIHNFIKKYCKDIVTWDGETDVGRVRSREAFIIKNSALADRVIEELYARIEDEIHGNRKTIIEYKLKHAAGKAIKNTLLLAPRLAGTILAAPLPKKTRKKLIKKMWK